MSKGKRGRPKGTELDDSGDLEKIAGLIVSDPKLRPTTAIKRLGITDESKTRRLRGKWKERSNELLKAATKKKKVAPASMSSNSRIADLGCSYGNPIQEAGKVLERYAGYERAVERAENLLKSCEPRRLFEAEASFFNKVDPLSAANRAIERLLERERLYEKLIERCRSW